MMPSVQRGPFWRRWATACYSALLQQRASSGWPFGCFNRASGETERQEAARSTLIVRVPEPPEPALKLVDNRLDVRLQMRDTGLGPTPTIPGIVDIAPRSRAEPAAVPTRLTRDLGS